VPGRVHVDGAKNQDQTVQTRLVARIREIGVEHQLTQARLGGERPPCRLSNSNFADRFAVG
jgi:hypothetical protein